MLNFLAQEGDKMDRYKCNSCWAICSYDEMLVVSNPYDASKDIEICPTCKDSECFDMMCDEPGCLNIRSCGTPTESGYRMVCYKHLREIEGL